MRKSDIALELFNEGYNCAQAVLSAFDEEIGLDRKTAIKISCEYGAGMAKGGTCGAVMGALMVLEFKLKQNNSGNSNLEELVFNAQGNLKNKFKYINNTTICKELISQDLSTEQGFQYALNNNIFVNICPKFVKDSVEILEVILKNEKI